ncbi:MAG: peptidoglycan DD-metalloendopeptidase family protein [Candidatus Levybacteria bacterium]|nr:peptidoglycan DD-metalloendopeptidase family protein [Candidatus Levybacteria bacterium]
MKRGRYNRPFLHMATMGVLSVGVLIGPYLADTYPVFTQQARANTDLAFAENQQQSIETTDNVFSTDRSEKPRDKVLTYTVQKGDTISTIAKKFGISTDTIKWSNDLSSDAISVGDNLKIIPVTGILHKVGKGESIYTIAKKYDTEAQKIVDFPFNEFANPETFALVDGQELIVPDGIKPDVSQNQRNTIKQQQQTFFAQGAAPAVSAGGFSFPLPGSTGVSQYASWYHMALDMTAPIGTPVVAAHNGTVTQVSIGSWDGGYGNNVWISDGQGTDTHYAHMSSVSVSVGQSVAGGRTVLGLSGNTGRSTGPHLHFEVRRNGALQNPLLYLR